MRASSDRGRGGSSFLICSISFSRSDVVERRPERQQLVEGQPQRVDVGAGVALAAEPLGRHVAERAQDVAGLGQAVVLRLGQAEVGDPDDARVVEQQVRRLDVAVDDAAGVGVGQPLRRLAADLRHAPEERRARRPESVDVETGAPPGSTAEGPGGVAGPRRGRLRIRERRSPRCGSRPGSSRSVAAGPVAAAGTAGRRTAPSLRSRAGRSGATRRPGRARAPAGRSPRRPRSARGRPPRQASARVAQPRQLVDDLVEPLALDELHGVVGRLAVLADLEDRHDVGVVQPRRGLRLAAEPLQGLAVAARRGRAGPSAPPGGPG